MDQLNHYLPPQNLDAEKSVLGSVLIDKDAIVQVAGVLKPEHFYKQAHAAIFQAMLELHAKRQPIDLLTLGNRLKENNWLDTVGGRAYLIEMMSAVPTSTHIMKYADIVALKFARRMAIDRAQRIINLQYQEETDDPVADFQKEAAGMSGLRTGDRKANTVREWMDNLNYFDTFVENKSRPMFTGCQSLDEIWGGLHRGELSFLAARPGVGKTTMALAFARFMRQNGFRPAFVSAEMSIRSILDRILAQESGRPVRRYRSGQERLIPGSIQATQITEATAVMSEMDTILVNAHGMGPGDIRGALLPYMANGKRPDVVFVDYVQLLKSDVRNRERRNDELDIISRELSNIADEFDCHVCAMSQLSREGTGEPQLHHLRDSGCLEQVAHQVIMAWKPSEGVLITNDERATNIRVKVAKNRDGLTGVTSMRIDFASYRIVD